MPGDLSGDGRTEVIAGLPGVLEESFFVLYLEPDGSLGGQVEVSAGFGGFEPSTDDVHWFGYSLALLKSFDGILWPEIVAGAPWTDLGAEGFQRGAVFVLSLCNVKFMRSVATPRLGEPANPDMLRSGDTVPAIGRTWRPFVEPFAPFARRDVLMIGSERVNVPLPHGTLLCLPAKPREIVRTGTRFAVAIPHDCSLVGTTFVAQAVSIDETRRNTPASSIFHLTNALDVTIGIF